MTKDELKNFYNDDLEKYELNERLFERDIKTLRNFLMEVYIGSEIVFDRRENTYYLSSWEKINPGPM